MPWTTPATWTVGEEVTAALLNAQLRDNLNWLHDPSRYWAKARVTGSYGSIPSGSNLLSPVDTVTVGEDPSGMVNTTTHLFTIPATGLYIVTGAFRVVSGSTPYAALAASLYINATSGNPQVVGSTAQAAGSVISRLLKLNVGDTVGLCVWQNSGGGLSWDTGFGGTGNSLAVACLSLQP